MNNFKTFLKFFIKSFMPFVGDFLLLFDINKKEHRDNDKKILIIFGGGIGDVVKRNIICEFIKKYLDNYEIFYLLPYELKFPYARKIIYFGYNKAKINPFYYGNLVKNLRKYNFSTIVTLLPFWENFLFQLANSVKPKTIYVFLETPPYFYNILINKLIYLLRFLSIKKRVKFIKLYSVFDKKWPKNFYPYDVFKNAYFISAIIKDIKKDVILNKFGILEGVNYKTEILVDKEFEDKYIKFLKEKYNLEKENYCILGLGGSGAHKYWDVEKYVDVAKFLKNKGFKIVLVGGSESIGLVKKFKTLFGNDFIDLINQTSLEELCILIKNSRLVVANDTSFIHIAVAFKIPSVCPISNTQLGVDSLYGYSKINRWVYIEGEKDINSLKKITAEMVIKEIEKIFEQKKLNEEKFNISYFLESKN